MSAYYTVDDIKGHSASIEKLRHLLYKISNADLPVLIRGESGSGKELVAQSLHNLSNRRKEPFIAINCGAIPKDLLESELFGHIKGSFTGAYSDRTGKLKSAGKGSLFLDEIGEMPLILQVKLLRVIQEKVYSPLGSSKKERLNARIICATNKDLKKMIANGSFREDLYYRINGVEVRVPPLRERKEDIIVLAEYFLEKYSKKSGKIKLKNLGNNLKKSLVNYSWPGNVRELENLIEREVIFCGENDCEINHIAQNIIEKDTIDLKLPVLNLEKLEDLAIRQAIASTDSISEAATLLGISRATMYRKMSKYGINS